MNDSSHRSYLRYLEKLLRNIDDATQLLDILDPFLHRRRVLLTRRVQDVLLLADLTLSPIFVQRPSVTSYSPENAKGGQHDN